MSLPRFTFWAAGADGTRPGRQTVEGPAGEKRGRWKVAFVYELTLAKLTRRSVVCLAEKAFFAGESDPIAETNLISRVPRKS